jgi:hypothetical protein
VAVGPRAWVLWLEDGVGAERCSLGAVPGGFRLEGTALRSVGNLPVEARYTILVDDAWRTRRIEIEVDTAGRRRASVLTVGEDGRWRASGRAEPALDGCVDVDLSFSPSTNTLPIRRLGLKEGEAADVEAVWIGFPELPLERLVQRYERTGPDRYRYSAGSFAADLVVDGNGLVLEYENAWRAVGRAAG